MIEFGYRPRGFTVRLDDRVDLKQMQRFRFQIMDELAGMEGDFVMVLDVRRFGIFTADAQALLEEILENLPERGLRRVSVIGVSTAFAGLFVNIMLRSDLMSQYQFLDLAYETDWKGELESWLNGPFDEDAA